MKAKYFLSLALSTALLFCNSISVSCLTLNNASKGKEVQSKKYNSEQVFNYKNNTITLSDKDIYLMAQIVFAESKAEPYDGKIAVASVILNRLLHPQFPKTVEGVVKQKGAFSCVVDGKLNVTPDEECFNAVFDALKGMDPTNQAVFFYNPRTATSKWMKNVKKANVRPIGNHVFFVVNR